MREHSFEQGPIRPPSEGGSYSLIIRATRNCPWNLCRFCDSYKAKKFVYRSVDEIRDDIDQAQAISDEITELTQRLGYDYVGEIALLLRSELQLEPNVDVVASVTNVFNWLQSGARTAFLQDADSLIMRTHDLLEVIKYLKQTFPSIGRITSYARARTLAKVKTLEELRSLREAGLSRLHVGLESGDDEVLKYVNKGVDSREHILAGRKAKEAGFEISEYVMPGLGGRTRSRQHARNTAKVLNKIDPDFIRLRPYIPRKGTSLFEEYKKGIFQLTSPYERLRELRIFVDGLEVNSRICFDHSIMNSWYRDPYHRYPLFKLDYDGYKLPEEKARILKLIEEGLKIDESNHVHPKDLIKMPYL